MEEEKVYIAPNLHVPNKPIVIDEKICTGCNNCVDVCMMDIFAPNPQKGKPPIIMHPDECRYGGSCVLHCPEEAMTLTYPMTWKVRWKRKATGEHFRLGMPNPPAPNLREPIPGGFVLKRK
jgi:NAD-dependent dihydropyrimidine dehydrogenase PreA subunit